MLDVEIAIAISYKLTLANTERDVVVVRIADLGCRKK